MQADELIPITFNKILHSKAYTIIILGNDEKRFAIYAGSNVGKLIQTYMSAHHFQRPMTLDLFNSVLSGLDVKPLQIVIEDVRDTIYFARLFLEQQIGEMRQIIEIDARPSDCITLALINKVPVYCKREIFEKAVPIEI